MQILNELFITNGLNKDLVGSLTWNSSHNYMVEFLVAHLVGRNISARYLVLVFHMFLHILSIMGTI
jgi:hypothetical protein